MRRSLRLDELAQVKALADPLRVRIVEALLRAPATTKQLAAALGERATRLYHHVEALERAGLIELVRTRRVRGAVEKYYRPVAREFVVDRRLFAPGRGGRGGAAADAVRAMMADILRTTGDEIDRAAAAGTLPLDDPARAEVARVHVRTSDARVVALMARLRELLAEAQAADAEGGAADYRLTVAFYPAPEAPPPGA